jgi:hypothetical protein
MSQKSRILTLRFSNPSCTTARGERTTCGSTSNLPPADIELSDPDLSEIDQTFSTIDVTGAPLSEALDSQVQR